MIAFQSASPEREPRGLEGSVARSHPAGVVVDALGIGVEMVVQALNPNWKRSPV